MLEEWYNDLGHVGDFSTHIQKEYADNIIYKIIVDNDGSMK